MKAIMISIKPKWVAKILNGEKTIEIRKTMPKCDLPIDVYIYCTKGKPELYFNNGKSFIDIGEQLPTINSKVVAKFTLNKVNAFFFYDETFLEDSCLTSDELDEYADNKNVLYAWHIDNLVIFDKPKELSEFRTKYWKSHDVFIRDCYRQLTRAPQSWCYIEID